MNEPLFLLYYWKPATDCSSHSYIGSDISCLFTNLVTIGNVQYKVTLSNPECVISTFSAFLNSDVSTSTALAIGNHMRLVILAVTRSQAVCMLNKEPHTHTFLAYQCC